MTASWGCSGRGCGLALVGGAAGIGKTALTEALCAETVGATEQALAIPQSASGRPTDARQAHARARAAQQAAGHHLQVAGMSVEELRRCYATVGGLPVGGRTTGTSGTFLPTESGQCLTTAGRPTT